VNAQCCWLAVIAWQLVGNHTVKYLRKFHLPRLLPLILQQRTTEILAVAIPDISLSMASSDSTQIIDALVVALPGGILI